MTDLCIHTGTISITGVAGTSRYNESYGQASRHRCTDKQQQSRPQAELAVVQKQQAQLLSASTKGDKHAATAQESQHDWPWHLPRGNRHNRCHCCQRLKEAMHCAANNKACCHMSEEDAGPQVSLLCFLHLTTLKAYHPVNKMSAC